MAGCFNLADASYWDEQQWGSRRWMECTAERSLGHVLGIEVKLHADAGHAFHFHPRQDELIFVLDGKVEQWIEQEMKVLGPGDAVLIKENTIHASFAYAGKPARLLAILGPRIGESGYELEEVYDQEPWRSIRS